MPQLQGKTDVQRSETLCKELWVITGSSKICSGQISTVLSLCTTRLKYFSGSSARDIYHLSWETYKGQKRIYGSTQIPLKDTMDTVHGSKISQKIPGLFSSVSNASCNTPWDICCASDVSSDCCRLSKKNCTFNVCISQQAGEQTDLQLSLFSPLLPVVMLRYSS